MAKARAQASKDKMRRQKQQDLSFSANNVVKLMLDNPAYPTMQPNVKTLQGQAVTYAECLTKIKEKSSKATQEKNTAKELLLKTLLLLIDQINLAVNEFTEKEFEKDPDADANYIKNAGFELRDTPVRKGKETPATPIVKSVAPTNKVGTIAVELGLDPDNTVKITAMMVSYDDGATYETDHKYLVDTSGTITGLRPASIATVRFASVGANAEASEWTAPRRVAIL